MKMLINGTDVPKIIAWFQDSSQRYIEPNAPASGKLPQILMNIRNPDVVDVSNGDINVK